MIEAFRALQPQALSYSLLLYSFQLFPCIRLYESLSGSTLEFALNKVDRQADGQAAFCISTNETRSASDEVVRCTAHLDIIEIIEALLHQNIVSISKN